MPERLTPGVYVEEIPGGVRPIQGVGTSTAAFVGPCQRGIPDRATFLTGFRDFERQFGGHSRGEAGFVAQAVDAFFSSGGRRAYVVRVLPDNAGPAAVSSALPARADDAWGVRHDVLRFVARGQGAWADRLRIHVEDSASSAGESFTLRVEWVEAGRSRTVERFEAVRMDPASPDYVVRLVNESSQYVTAVDLFRTDFLDAAERSTPPIPGRAPALDAVPGADGDFSLPVGAELTFAWDDLTRSPETQTQARATVELSQDAIEDAGGTVAAGTGTLTAAQLQALLDAELPDTFTVTEADGHVLVAPAVATGALVAAQLPDGRDDFDVAALDDVTVTVTDDTGAVAFVVDTTADDTLTPQELADRINAQVQAGDDRVGTVADGAGRFLVVTTAPDEGGVTVALGATGGAAPWQTPVTAGGGAGA